MDATAPHAVATRLEDRLPLGVCLGFGVGTIGVSVMLNTVTAYFPAFMSTVLGQSPEIAGLLMMASKLYDAVCDVVVGMVSDRTRSRWGRRRPYLLVGAFVSAASFVMLFVPPKLGGAGLIAYMAAALVLYSTGYSIFNVPYIAMPSEMTEGYAERTRLISYRTLFVSLGQLLALAATSALIIAGGGGVNGYAVMGVVMTLVILTSMLASFFGTAKARQSQRGHAAPTLGALADLKGCFAQKPFALLVGAKIFQFLSFSSVSATGLLFLLNVLHVGYAGQIKLSVASNLATAASMPVWVRVAKLIGKRNVYLVGVAIYCLAALSWLLATPAIGDVGLLTRAVAAGAGSGAVILMAYSMLADTMAYERRVSGAHREGVMSSIIAVIEKTAFAVGVGIVGALLKVAGYIATTGGHLVPQPASALRMLYLGYAVIPIVMFSLNALFLAFYDLDHAKLQNAELRTS